MNLTKSILLALGGLVCVSLAGVVQASDSGTPGSNVSGETGTTINGHEYVDLGLSVLWATCNVGANKPTEFGGYYAWGETSTKSSYTKENSETQGKVLGDIGGTEFDVARATWGGEWRMPTKAEFEELWENTNFKETTVNDVWGLQLTSIKNGKTIFFPHADYRDGTETQDIGGGFYWSSTPDDNDATRAYFEIYFLGSMRFDEWGSRYQGYSVRPVIAPASR